MHAPSDRPKGTIWLAKSHDGGSANVWAYRLQNLTLEHKADHLRQKPQEQIRGSGPQSIADMRGAQTRPPGPRSERKREKGLAHLIRTVDRSSLGSNTTQGVHVSTVRIRRQRMKETKGRNNIISGLNGRILQERSASPTKSTLLDESGHPVDRGFGMGIRSIDGVPGGALLPSPGSRRGLRSARRPLSQSRHQRRTSPS